MANYLSLEEAAEKLGIPTERLVDLRSQGEVRGFRDGSSWKFPEDEIERLANELADGFGGDFNVELDNESTQPTDGSDVNLVAAEGEGSDVAIVTHPDVLSSEADKGSDSGGSSGSMLDLGGEVDDIKINTESDLSFPGLEPDDDSGEELLGADDDSIDVLGSDIEQPSGSQLSAAGASNLEMMDDLNDPGLSDVAPTEPRGADVLSELDVLSAEQQDSGLITGDSAQLLGSSGLGSGLGSGGLDDALDDDDDLVIADDDDDLVISNAGSDISVAGDSGINLMSPSDSGLSLESEPLDLAGSSISALDLGAELSEGGSSSGSGGSGEGSGSMVDFQADEEFQLSPSGVGLDADIESDSQVIEVEDSEAIAEPIEFGDVAVAGDPLGGDVFGEPEAASDAFAMDEEGEAIAIDESASTAVAPAGMGGGGYEVPFSLPQCLTLMLILFVLSLGGMLMTDLVRNMWTYSEPTAPVSSLTDSLIAWMGWGQ